MAATSTQLPKLTTAWTRAALVVNVTLPYQAARLAVAVARIRQV